MKKIIALILALVALLSFASCAGKAYSEAAKNFSNGGMTITLTNAFEKIEMAGCAAVYTSKDAVVYVYNQPKSEFDDVKDMSIRKYLEFFCETNKEKYEIDISAEGDIFFVEYSSASDKATYKYLSAFFESDKKYVRVEFVAEEKNYAEYRPYFINWAKTVTFDKDA